MNKKLYHGDKCPICNGEIKASGFNGNLFCWGECYCYINSQKYQKLFSTFNKMRVEEMEERLE